MAELGNDTSAIAGDEKRVHEMHGEHAQELPAGHGAGGEVLELSAMGGGRDRDDIYSTDTKAENLYQQPVELPGHEHSPHPVHSGQ